MFCEFSWGCGVRGRALRSWMDAVGTRGMRNAAWWLMLALALTCPPEMLLGQSANAGNSADSSPQTNQKRGPAGVASTPAAAENKVAPEDNYDEVHVKPIVKSDEAARFDPNSPAAAEAEVDPSPADP